MASRSCPATPPVLGAFLPQNAAFALVVTPGAEATFELAIEGGLSAAIDGAALFHASTAAVNRLHSHGCEHFWTCWVSGSGLELHVCRANILPEWTLEGVGTAFLLSNASSEESEQTATYACPVEGLHLAAAPGEAYRFSGLFGLHRCTGRVAMIFCGQEGELSRVEADIPAGFMGGRHPRDYAAVILEGVCHSDATSVKIEVVKGLTEMGADSLLFFTRPHLCRAKLEAAPEYEIELPSELGISLFSLAGAELLMLPLGLGEESDFYAPKEVVLVDRTNGRLVAEGRLAPDDTPFALEIARLEGSVLIIRVNRSAVWLKSVAISLWIDGAPFGDREFTLPATGDMLRFPVPVGLLDAQPHLFELKLAYNGRLLATFVGIAPDLISSPSLLASQRALPAFFTRTPAAEQRYLALGAALKRFAEAQPAAATAVPALRGFARAHKALEDGFSLPRKTYDRLDIDRPTAPQVSVIIPVHNKFSVTYNCLAALRLAGANTTFEVVVVDDGSDDTTLQLPEIEPGVIYVRNSHPLGFVGACNRGAEVAAGAFFVFLNNDTEPTLGWIDELLYVFEQFEGVGLVGSKLVYPDGRLQDAGGIVWNSGDPWNYGRGGNPHDPRFCYTRQVDYLSGAAVMIDRTLWAEVGGFSTEFAPAYFEDTDLAFKVRAAGKRTVFAPHSLVYHYEGMSNGTDVAVLTGLKRFQEVNRPKFKQKWRHAFGNNGSLGQNVDLIKDRQIERRVVFFDLEVPKPDENAGGYASLQEVRLFQSLGFKVTFVPISLNYTGRHVRNIQRMGVEVIYSPYYSSLEQFIEQRGADFDLAYVTRYQTAARVTDALRAVSNAPVICNVADLHYLRAMRKASAEGGSAEELAAAERLKVTELGALSKVDLALSYSDVETDLMASVLPRHVKVGRLPWVVDTSTEVAPLNRRHGVAFLGGFIHSPNTAAVEFFAATVMPLLRDRIPGCTFHIYGSNIPPAVANSLSAKDVIVEGFTPDVAAVFDTCRVFVCPLTYGAGVKGKVLDCLAAGIPSVLSTVAAEGLPIKSGREALIADTPQEWADAVVTLYTNDALWNSMSEAARRLASRRFAFEPARATMAELLTRVGVEPAAGWPLGFFPIRSRPPMPRVG